MGEVTIESLTCSQIRRGFGFVVAQKAVQLVMAKLLAAVVSKVGQGVIDLTTEQVLTVIKARHRCFMGNKHSERLLGFSTLA